MGLRLYQAPVESDLKTKPPVDKVAQSRSPIRRAVARRTGRAASPLRRRHEYMVSMLAAQDRSRPVPAANDGDAPPTTDTATSSVLGESGTRALRHPSSRTGPTEDYTATVFGERWTQLRAASQPDLDQTQVDVSDSWQYPVFRDPRRGARPSASAAEPSYAISNLRSTQLPSFTQLSPLPAALVDRDTENLARPHSGGVSFPDSMPPRYADGPRSRARVARPRVAESTRVRRATSSGRTSRVGTTQVDGLGDRNRSLSPEGDHVWDTLLSSITPDPQPPSVGSSFASNSASLAASSGHSDPASSSTSLAEPQNATEPALEPPCESVCEISDTEGDEDDDTPLFPLRRFSRPLPPYAQVARSSNAAEDAAESLDGMLRIVRHLARREDIPDEWWAEAGLSRTLSRGDSAL